MKQLRFHCLQHVAFEDPGYIKTWITENQDQLTTTHLYLGEPLPLPDSFDWLIVMGGPMSVGDEADYSWLKAEKSFIRNVIDAGKTVVGICLGAQLIANALGAAVCPNRKKEIGWFPVSLTEAGKKSSVTQNLPKEMTVLHWHGDTFDLPEGAVHLARTEICPNQAFLFKERVLGLQFHFEATPETLIRMIENCRHELVPDEFVQCETAIMQNAEHCAKTNKWLAEILTQLAQEI
jgi:GMP synthase-like glutamine amidotransferase